MARTNIDIDEGLVAEVMRRYGLSTKREAVHLALQRLVGHTVTTDDVLSLRGVGGDGDLDELRSGDSPEDMWRSA
ncbi:Arc/MetJ family transcription regulator [Crossiella equi]|uniref:Arc/MetJ family transcription regulator n=1 Tax=Crossiella equi TaxID=130796 RepID=A0ABS5AK27_9PSEU|nr:type II toxin-antitoxin system VapB family antitoxin [Crossiella equi]MBP2476923.1 Arc/MetJ family transcription regulator [Crossiella equi]